MCVYLSYCFLWTWTFWLFSSDLRHQKSIFIQRTVSHWIMDHSLLTLDMVVWEKPSRPSLSEIFAPAHLEQYPCHIQSHSYHSFFYSDTRCELQQVILMCLHPRWLTGIPNKVANECTYFAVNIVFQYSFFFCVNMNWWVLNCRDCSTAQNSISHRYLILPFIRKSSKRLNVRKISYFSQFSTLPLGIKFNFWPKVCTEKEKKINIRFLSRGGSVTHMKEGDGGRWGETD